jgi:hypothetical protein
MSLVNWILFIFLLFHAAIALEVTIDPYGDMCNCNNTYDDYYLDEYDYLDGY